MLMRRAARLLLAALMVAVGLQGGLVRAEERLEITEFTVDPDTLCDIRDEWTEQLLATHKPGTWAKMKFEVTDSQLSRMGLPSKDVLSSRRYARPTLVTKDGRFYDVPTRALEQAVAGPGAAAEPTVASVAGAGCLGIRPGALLLLISGNSIGWCSMAHVYGSPGSYDISTAGHCGRPGDTATVIAGTGNRGDATGVVLLDFGTFATSTDGGLGNDWALINISPAYQGLVSPTMCVWGGPRGMYTNTGQVVGVNFPGNSLIPEVSLTPDPTLAQTVVHYGHGTGVGAGGTPRAGEAIAWGASHFMFFGAISPGDSGSGANTLLGDAVGANMEAAGIMTHLFIDPLMRQGLGIMGGTRATSVAGTLANGQIVPYPATAPGLA
jgi:hypothetical protein